MAVYNGTQATLNAALNKYRWMGFSLVAQNGRYILYYRDTLVNSFPEQELTIFNLHRTCEHWLQKVNV